ncbi:hypothetical protein GCM10023195_51340 [Actinoallomurus liliacearum]|uniref:Uncharacterized protein n=1 Tax=Actinoallomurus liliacearum TaxID=1080073 RepID=A0ABP8TPU0_9ACTN
MAISNQPASARNVAAPRAGSHPVRTRRCHSSVAADDHDRPAEQGSNVASFARLAAFGLAHAAIGLVVWNATRAVWQLPSAGAVAAVVVFTVGNLLAFVLEGVVVAVQALRLEYYEPVLRGVFTTAERLVMSLIATTSWPRCSAHRR